jgi:hypothetical protein
MSGFDAFPRSNAASRLRKFRLVYDTTCSILDALGIPFRDDQDCSVLYDDTDPRELVGNSISYHFNGEIVICRRHLQEPLQQCQVTLVHEITHYWCEAFPEVMRKQHLFRVPRPQPLPPGIESQSGARDLVSRYHHLAYDSDNEDFLGSYSQVSSDECLAEFMAHLVVHDPDLRRVASPRARRRFRACRRMLDGLRRAYATYDQVG